MELIWEEDHEVYLTIVKIEKHFRKQSFTVKTRAKSAASCRVPLRFINLKWFEFSKF